MSKLSTPWYDKIGQEIKEGDFVAYGCLKYESASLQIGKVVGYSDKNKLQVLNENGMKKALDTPQRVIIINKVYDPGTMKVYPHDRHNKKPVFMFDLNVQESIGE